MKSLLLLVLLPLLLCFIVREQVLIPDEPLNEQTVVLEKGLNSSVNWPFKQGPGAPYDINPVRLSFHSTPKRGYSNVFTFNFTMRQTACNYWYGWEAELNGNVVDYYYHNDVKSCLKTGVKHHWTANISTFVRGPSGNYSFRIFFEDDDPLYPVLGDVRFNVNI